MRRKKRDTDWPQKIPKNVAFSPHFFVWPTRRTTPKRGRARPQFFLMRDTSLPSTTISPQFGGGARTIHHFLWWGEQHHHLRLREKKHAPPPQNGGGLHPKQFFPQKVSPPVVEGTHPKGFFSVPEGVPTQNPWGGPNSEETLAFFAPPGPYRP